MIQLYLQQIDFLLEVMDNQDPKILNHYHRGLDQILQFKFELQNVFKQVDEKTQFSQIIFPQEIAN
jgi:hypothetical protein